jgi:putative spermidine/putrescine transport system ATP-binding protein
LADSDSKLKIRDLRKTYGPVVALAGANFDLREGEFLTLLGPSGSGKTTMLMIIAGLTPPDSGEVWIDGNLATYAPTFKRDIGMVFQNYALFPHLNVYENIAFPLRMRKMPEATITREVARALEVVQLPDVDRRLPRELSGGQQQRIALARCVVYQPSIILMDEPLGALDKKLRDQMQLEIKHLHTELDITVLYVTHDQEEALAMSDRICLMNSGEIDQLGTPDELYFRPETIFAADFLGESNLLEATVASASGHLVHLRGPTDIPFRAAPRGDVREGETLKFMVRPENIRLLADGEDMANMLTATLRDVILAGQVTKYYARLADGTVVSATQLTSVDAPSAEPGSEVRFGWSEESTLLLPQRRGSRAT